MGEIETRLQGRIASDSTCDCITPDDCMCERFEWEYFEECNNAFFDSSDVFYFEKNGVAEITEFRTLTAKSPITGTWGKAYSFLQEVLHRCNQYVLTWERDNGALFVRLGATYIEVRPTEMTQCAMCGDVIEADQDIIKRLNFLHPDIYPLPTYYDGIPFCHKCKDVYHGQYVVIVTAFHRYMKYKATRSFAINCTPEEVEADYYIKASDVFTKNGYAPSPDYHVFSIGKIQEVFSTNEWKAVRIEDFKSLSLM